MNSPIGSRTTLLAFLQELDQLLSEPVEVILAGAACRALLPGVGLSQTETNHPLSEDRAHAGPISSLLR